MNKKGFYYEIRVVGILLAAAMILLLLAVTIVVNQDVQCRNYWKDNSIMSDKPGVQHSVKLGLCCEEYDEYYNIDKKCIDYDLIGG